VEIDEYKSSTVRVGTKKPPYASTFVFDVPEPNDALSASLLVLGCSSVRLLLASFEWSAVLRIFVQTIVGK